MEALFAFFEDMEEMVYISDIETHELIYMNRCLRETLGYLDHEDYRGKPCYAVLQGKDVPCSFCNNRDLRVKKFLTWPHENPVLDQTLLVRDRLLFFQGRRYRVEIATRADEADYGKNIAFYNRGESILNSCLRCFFVTQNTEESIDMLLDYLGRTFCCARVHIFEFCGDGTVNNTYEWCSQGTVPQQELLQRLPQTDIGYWISAFEQHEAVLIRKLKEIRLAHPITYSLLYPQGLTSLVAVPIYDGETLLGFIGVDDPDRGTLPLLEQVLQSLSGSLAMQLKRRNLYRRFNAMSYRDSLTGTYNRNAMEEHGLSADQWDSFGVVYCDINGLKKTNDVLGHSAGNAMLQNCSAILKQTLHTEWIYRVGGDEFVAHYYNVEEARIREDLEALRLAVLQSDCQMAIGYAWSNQRPIDVEHVTHQADVMMYQEKMHFYAQLKKRANGIAPMQANGRARDPFEQKLAEAQGKLQKFLLNTYCDIPFLLTLMSASNRTSYFFFGDMQKNLFYISDNMREKFGFESNIVADLIHRWAVRIQDPELLGKFWKDIKGVLQQKQTCHDLRYPIADAEGNSVWIRSFGKIKWDDDGKTPLFFAGRISQQDEGFVVDSLTNFPTETVLLRHLNRVRERNHQCRTIGISFNNITQINNNLGRLYGDDLVRSISERLYEKLSHRVIFYRLNGMRCIALADVGTIRETEEIIREMKAVIEDCYQRMGLSIQNPCSFALLAYPRGEESPQDFIESMVSLIKVARNDPGRLYIDNSNGDIQKIQSTSNMEMRLTQDIMNGMKNFRVVVQPVVSVANGEPVGGETLLRWKFEGRDVSPGVFIPIIERENLIHLVGRWVFEQAVHVCQRILCYRPDFYLTVNASLQQLNDDGFMGFIRKTLEKYRMDGTHIVIEMTESCMDEQPEKLDSFVESCAAMGIRIALDDFGSGYSSLRVLLQYPSSIIKLDRSLLLEMMDSSEKNNFITSIVYACHQFGKQVCMEGVETEFQNELVKATGCDTIQGFYYYRPMELEQIFPLLAEEHGQESAKGDRNA